MINGRKPKRMRAAPQGAWLAFLAVVIQVLLPFLVAFEIAAASTPAYAETSTICLSSGSTATPAHHEGETTHHGLTDGCPICVALAVGQAFTTPAPIASSMPQVVRAVLFAARPHSPVSALRPASYNPRAPPFIV